MKIKLFVPVTAVLFSLFSIQLQAEIITKVVNYSDGDIKMKGYLAYDDSIKGKRPGVIVVHEWWGHDDYAKKRARMLAKLGYHAIALDMYGNGKKAGHPKDAGAFSGAVKKNMAVAEKRFMAAYRVLQKQDNVTKDKIAAIGYCFGGGIVIEMARRGVDLDGVVSFHGSLGTKEKARKGKVKAKVLVLNGQADPFVKKEAIAGLKEEMKAAKVDFKFINYPGAKHSFTNPGANEYGKKFNLPLAYNAEADKKSWNEMKVFLNKVF
ncbi:MAG: dienelactone hydrolase family protein [Gammaproteobacteria bacterium]|nr:dienelactone hydrolase family protein [Gammaproteobacteria bacterium]